jgi:hypothetical protein
MKETISGPKVLTGSRTPVEDLEPVGESEAAAVPHGNVSRPGLWMGGKLAPEHVCNAWPERGAALRVSARMRGPLRGKAEGNCLRGFA